MTQFNSVAQAFIIMTAVILSLGGAFLGLTVLYVFIEESKSRLASLRSRAGSSIPGGSFTQK